MKPSTCISAVTAALAAVLAACAPTAERGGLLPHVPGAYPRAEGTGPASLATREEAWRPARDFVVLVPVDAGAAAFFGGLPPLGTPVVVREVSWPARVRLAGVDERAATLRGDPVAARTLAAELRCAGKDDAGRPVELVVEVAASAAGLSVQPRFDGMDVEDCELSAQGRRRLQRAAVDVFLWARGVARAGTGIPAEDA